MTRARILAYELSEATSLNINSSNTTWLFIMNIQRETKKPKSQYLQHENATI